MTAINIERKENLDYKSNEAYKSLRTNIQLCGSDIKVIMITSTAPNEGKSMVSFNLAVSLSETGKKVIFIDADLRKSVMVGQYMINMSVMGLTHFLSGICKFEEVVYSTNYENLDTVFAGPVEPNPAELLSDISFKHLISTLRETYDYIIIDTPPLGNVIDGAIVAQECDGAVFVIAAKFVSHKFVKNAVAQLKKTDCKILGAVLNKVDMSENGNYGKYYGKKYGK
ncbi:CpsD/CapB family tyrosine-protein kinase [[Clostridium] fimetarium]|uniref:non-specific protein-tyrosine kinase n=1 Tax=[Clostridium] fimetarium TaxID=99656 RepID=A0A1I0RLQ5_9FIRM|nr:CpsD/CapB family tyrosine-protein kinase [[Clostridium] fimetarium]SEW42099.1 capsular exopolysaccharide family [[Clostridium] fimetarium]